MFLRKAAVQQGRSRNKNLAEPPALNWQPKQDATMQEQPWNHSSFQSTTSCLVGLCLLSGKILSFFYPVFLVSIKWKCCTHSISKCTKLRGSRWVKEKIMVHKQFVLAVLLGTLVKVHHFKHLVGSKDTERLGRSLI